MMFYEEMEPKVSNRRPGDVGKATPLAWSCGLYLLVPELDLWVQGLPEQGRQAQHRDLHPGQSTRRTSIHPPGTRSGLLQAPKVHLKRVRIGSTKQDAEASAGLHSTTARPALIKDSLQTGASHWADFWNGFLFIPRDTSRAEGGFMQYRSVSHWQRLMLWQAAWLGWKSRLGLGLSRLRYWIIDRRSPWCKGRANHSLSSIKMKWKPSLKPTLAR